MNPQLVTFKLWFGENDIRRITLDNVATWEAFIQHLIEVYPDIYHPELAIRYKDEENDLVTITSQKEWEEMLRATKGQSVIRLFISEGKNAGRYFKDGPPPEPCAAYIETPNAPIVELPVDEGAVRTLSIKLPRCLARLFPGGKILPTNIPSWLEKCIEVKSVPGPTPTLDLDVDVVKLFDELHDQALSRIGPDKERTVMERAKDFLLSMVDLVPSHPLANYNLACVHSLLGEVKEAAAALRVAIEAGFDNIKHILQDVDLTNLRNAPEWNDILRLIGHARTEEAKQVDEEAKDKEVEMVEIRSVVEKTGDEREKDLAASQDWVQLNVEAAEDGVVVLAEDPKAEKKEEVETISPVPTECEPKKEEERKPDSEAVHLEVQFQGKWAQQLATLAAMGFTDVGRNTTLLNKYRGNVARVVDALLD